jgi:hypothetical protein
MGLGFSRKNLDLGSILRIMSSFDFSGKRSWNYENGIISLKEFSESRETKQIISKLIWG